MGSTSAAWDNTAPPEIQEVARLHILAEKARGNPLFANRTHLDQDGCCFIQDLGGEPCPGDSCLYHPVGRKIGPDYASHKPLEKPIPGLAVAAAKAGPARKRRAAPARKRKPAARKRPAGRKAARRKPAGRRRR